MKFVIVSHKQTGGGAIVLHKLAKILQECGYDSTVFYVREVSDNRGLFLYYQFKYNIKEFVKLLITKVLPDSKFSEKIYQGYIYLPVHGCKRKYIPWVDDDTIVIYPEILRGNPLHAKHVVRWLLFYNRFPGDDTWYAPSDLFVAYREQFNDKKLNPRNYILKIFNFDYELYKRTNYGSREGSCYVIRKGSERCDLPGKFDGPVIDDLCEPEKVRILNQCEKCYLYDTQTFYASIAALCGCIPIVVPEPGKTRSDYVKGDDYIPGVAYGDTPEEIDYAVRTRGAVAQGISELLYENDKNVSSFVEICKRYFHLT